MAFRINPHPRFLASATITVPGPTGPEKQELRVLFNSRPEADLPQPGQSGDGREFLRAAIHELYDLEDDEGRAVAYSPAVLDHLLKRPEFRIGMVRAYLREHARAAVGN